MLEVFKTEIANFMERSTKMKKKNKVLESKYFQKISNSAYK